MAEFPPITHVAVTVTDLERSTRWYSELLAPEPVLDEDEQIGVRLHRVQLARRRGGGPGDDPDHLQLGRIVGVDDRLGRLGGGEEAVPLLHLDAVGAKLTALTKSQAEYIGVDVAGPYKPEHYRY